MVQRTIKSWQTNRLRLFLVKKFEAQSLEALLGKKTTSRSALNILGAIGEGINLYSQVASTGPCWSR